MPGRVLHVLSQRPSRTGSGITLSAMTGLAEKAGWTQAAVVGVPAGEKQPRVSGLARTEIFPVSFHDPENPGLKADLPFPLPGMSDVMPYPSSVWAAMGQDQLLQYRQVWKDHLTRVVEHFGPDLIHAHHIWLVTSLLRKIAPKVPVLATCHATGLRQMKLCPDLAEEVKRGCRDLDHFLTLREDHKEELTRLLGLSDQRVSVVGVGFRDDIFFCDPAVEAKAGTLLFVGKFSRAKGLPWLLEALEKLRLARPHAVLHVAGDGAGPEAEMLRAQMKAMSPAVVMHGQLNQLELADLMRRCRVCVLPSFYEGVPLVLAEAAACGCRIVATALPGVMEQIAPHLGPLLHAVPLPPLVGVDSPAEEGLTGFVENLARDLDQALHLARSGPCSGMDPDSLAPLTWQAVFARVSTIWEGQIRGSQAY
jgi:glycosyltransferase involved in cell wall biosynthesis